jgi:hypothetical protein
MYLREGTSRGKQKKYFRPMLRQEQNPMNRALGCSSRRPFQRRQSGSEKAVSRIKYAPETTPSHAGAILLRQNASGSTLKASGIS